MMKMSKNEKVFEYVNLTLLILICLCILYPLIYVISQSFSSPQDVYFGTVIFFPKNLSLKAYSYVLDKSEIWTGYLNTLIYTAVGTAIAMVLLFTAAFALSRKNLVFRKVFMTLYVIPMYFSGGIIPLYILMDNLELMNTMWSFILPSVLSSYYIILVRTYLSSSIPFELQESAMIDGANDLRIFVQIVLPLCKPIVAVMLLFNIVGYWNSYFNALIFISDESKFPLQIVLQQILLQSDTLGGVTDVSNAEYAMISEAVKYSSIVVSTLPILLAYPFFSKYFEKGLVLGGLKG